MSEMNRMTCSFLTSRNTIRRSIIGALLTLGITLFSQPNPLVAQVDQQLRLLPSIGLHTTGEWTHGPMFLAPGDMGAEGNSKVNPIQEIPTKFEPSDLKDPDNLPEEIAEIEQQPTNGWFYPHLWQRIFCWEGAIEGGLNGATGNSDLFSLTTGANAERVHGPTTFGWNLTYIKTKAESIETQHNLLLNVDYDFDFEDSPWSRFVKTFFEYDEFRAFDSRLSMNGGGGFDFFDNPGAKLTGRFGIGWSREYGGPNDRYIPESTFGANYKCQLTRRQNMLLDIQYLPSWEDFSNYRVVANAHWTILLDETTDLHLKLGAIDRYDSTPNGAQPNDLIYNMLLLWKL